ncbi:MAG: hypothetical protein M1444_03260 [Patescibacteria group bacterium]|nr:hypothetical protein [Patescibacteria group bacterium]
MPSAPVTGPFSRLSFALIKSFEEKEAADTDKKISVNILVSKVASWYEKLRTSMDYGNEETILRRAIERILKRRLFLDADPKSLAEDVVRELIWAGYFADATVPESIINKVASSIGLHLKLKDKIVGKRIPTGGNLFEFIIQLLSCEIDLILLPNKEREAMNNFMFHVLKNSVDIVDDSKQTRDVQVFIAIRKNFSREDIAFLRYRLFLQIFGKLSQENFEETFSNFEKGYKEIEYQLSYPRKDRIFNHIKKKTPPFLILYDLLIQERGNIRNLVNNQEDFRDRIYSICSVRYRNINRKVKTAIIRSFVFILFTKAFIAISIEGTFERFYYGSIQWGSIAINTLAPPLLMTVAGLGIKTPKTDNSQAIYVDIHKLLFEENPQIAPPLSVNLKKNSARTISERIFSALWFFSIVLVFGLVGFVLSKLHFNLLSQGIFLFFLAIVSFLTYRIYQTANTYTVIFKQNLITPIIDFFFVPIIRVGRRFTEGISQINFILILIDFIIEAPFKGLVGFFEQWFSFLATKREELE